MTVPLNIHRALETHAVAALDALVDGRIAYPNVDFQPPEGLPWARLDHLPGTTSPGGAGADSLTRHPGVFQVMLFWPKGQGTADILDAAGTLGHAFKRGTSISKDGTIVRIQGCSRGPWQNETAWLSCPVSISWLVYASDDPGWFESEVSGPSTVPPVVGDREIQGTLKVTSLLLSSPNGTLYWLVVGNDGSLSTEPA